MLVLTRGLGESFYIEPAGIKITLVGVCTGNRMRIGIDAPDKQTILREELVGKYSRYRKEAEQIEQRRRERNGTEQS
jgi:carbon storage regulator CsrA